MGYSLGLKTSSSQQQNSKVVKEKIISPRANLKFQDKCDVLRKGNNNGENTFGQPYIDRHRDLRKSAGDGSMVHRKSSGIKQKLLFEGKANKDDELVKHMYNLPGYLQRVERGEKLQKNALNFGVLDWECLEKWQCREKRIPTRVNKEISSSTSSSSFMASVPSTISGTAQSKSLGRSYSEIKPDRGKRKESVQMTSSQKETSLSDRRKNHSLSLSSYDSINPRGGESKIRDKKEFNLAHHHYPRGHQSVVSFFPNHSRGKSCSEGIQLSESTTFFDGNLTEGNRNSFSQRFSPADGLSKELYSEIPLSCTLPDSVVTQTVTETETSITAGTSNRLDQDITIQPAVKGRHTSLNRRFSFSLGRMARSLSFKEGSVVPQFSSTHTTVKSGPIKSEESAGLDHSRSDKANANTSVRSSPLKRLLDPLLKSKGAYPAETAHSSKGNTTELFQNKNREMSSVKAVLQLTIKNGLPLFKLMVDGSSDILVTAVKKLPTTLKDGDPSLIYAFYSVHEIRKKSGGWISQENKGEKCGFGYNIVGQMQVSNSRLPDFIGDNTIDQHIVREAVLYSVDRHADNETPEFLPNRELAAIVVKNLTEKTVDTRENGNSKGTIVILPGGIHGLPSKGVLSPLIVRWRSGGSCDCGGWDVGCKLRVLTNKMLKPSISCSTRDRLELFVQDGLQENKPIFSFAPLKNGLYSVEYNTSISLLQAFSICVAVISCQKLPYIFEVNSLLEAKQFVGPVIGSDTMKTATIVQQKVHAKYVPSPPSLQIERV